MMTSEKGSVLMLKINLEYNGDQMIYYDNLIKRRK